MTAEQQRVGQVPDWEQDRAEGEARQAPADGMVEAAQAEQSHSHPTI